MMGVCFFVFLVFFRLRRRSNSALFVGAWSWSEHWVCAPNANRMRSGRLPLVRCGSLVAEGDML